MSVAGTVIGGCGSGHHSTSHSSSAQTATIAKPPASGAEIGACFEYNGLADAEVTFASSKFPYLMAEVKLTDVTDHRVLRSGEAMSLLGQYVAAPGGTVKRGDRISCQIEKVVEEQHPDTVAFGAGPVVAEGPLPPDYGVGNGNTPW